MNNNWCDDWYDEIFDFDFDYGEAPKWWKYALIFMVLMMIIITIQN